MALAHTTSWAWSEQRAEQIVAPGRTIKLQRSERMKLKAQTLASVRASTGGLALAAAETQTSGTRSASSSRFSKALAAVRSGSKMMLRLPRLRKGNNGTALRAASDCAVASRALEIPSVKASSEGAELPTVIEGSPRVLGPWKGRLDVRVVGRSAMRYAQAQ